MINELIKLANHLDTKGYSKEADYIDSLVKRAQEERADKVGQYQVRAGDTLSEITRRFSPGRTVKDNADLNNIRPEDYEKIQPCQMLLIYTTPAYGGSLNSMNPECIEVK